jgi:hypothetical protein
MQKVKPMQITYDNKLDFNDINWPLQSFDARDWAKAFCKIIGEYHNDIDENLMIAWFANALMRGYDEHARRMGISLHHDS